MFYEPDDCLMKIPSEGSINILKKFAFRQAQILIFTHDLVIVPIGSLG